MIGLLLASALLSGAQSSAVAPPITEEPMVDTTMVRMCVEDARAFVAATYARYQANPSAPPPDQSYAYSPRLRALFIAYDDWSDQHSDLVGALDFDWWTNAQDYSIRRVALTERNEGADRRWIIANFDNYDRHDEVRFLFLRMHGRWCLDDAEQGTGHGGGGWTLSALLQEREQ